MEYDGHFFVTWEAAAVGVSEKLCCGTFAVTFWYHKEPFGDFSSTFFFLQVFGVISAYQVCWKFGCESWNWGPNFPLCCQILLSSASFLFFMTPFNVLIMARCVAIWAEWVSVCSQALTVLNFPSKHQGLHIFSLGVFLGFCPKLYCHLLLGMLKIIQLSCVFTSGGVWNVILFQFLFPFGLFQSCQW